MLVLTLSVVPWGLLRFGVLGPCLVGSFCNLSISAPHNTADVVVKPYEGHNEYLAAVRVCDTQSKYVNLKVPE